MSQKIKYQANGGFSLIEAMISTVIMAITFIGVYGLTNYAAISLKNSSDRQRMQVIADQMLETISSDFANIANYNMDFTTCAAPTSAQTQAYHQNRYKWCRMLNNSVGTPAAGDIRSISVTASGGNNIVRITLESKKKAAQVVIETVFD